MRKSEPFRRIGILASLLVLVFFSGAEAKVRQVKVVDPQAVIQNEQMEVILDRQFPRILEYRVHNHPQLLGALSTERPSVELNGITYTTAEFNVVSQVEPRDIAYRITFPALRLALGMRFELRAAEVLMQLTNVEESGSFRLNTLYFPNHYLIRMPVLMQGATMYRGEYQRRPWKSSNLPGSYSDSIPQFSAVVRLDAEQFPVRVNWAAAYTSDLCATIANNIGAWKLESQLLGFSGEASDFALWNGTFHYRLRGQVQPLLEAHIAILRRDENGDGNVDWMEAALWQHDLFPEPHRLYAGPTYVYKIINAFGPPNNEPVTSFEECLPIIESIAHITGGLPQIVYLVGWQYQGHDTGYPWMDKVNPDLGGLEKLRWLAREAKKYNAIVSYHINIDDAYESHPGWDPTVLSLGRNGKPYLRGFNPEVNLPRYLISHTKEVESGYFQKRAQAFLDAVPVEKTVHLDTLECTGVSFGPDEYIGVNDELEGCKYIIKWFRERGIDISTESPFDRFYGLLSWFLHKQEIRDPFQIIMMHGKAYGGGKPLKPVDEVLGWSTDMPVMAHPSKAYPMYSPYSVTQTSDTFYLGTLLQFYLDRKKLIFLGVEGDTYVARFEDGTVSRQKNGGPVLVEEGNLVIAKGQDRLIPLSNSEIRLYSADGGERVWTLPNAWAGAEFTLSALASDGSREVNQFQIEGNQLTLRMDPHRPYVLRKK